MSPVVTALTAVGALTLVLASLLVIANRKLHVFEDPRQLRADRRHLLVGELEPRQVGDVPDQVFGDVHRGPR